MMSTGNRLYFGNLDKDVTQEQLLTSMKERGVDVDSMIIRLKNGYAFVDCGVDALVDEIKDSLAELNINGQTVSIEKAQNRRGSTPNKLVVRNFPEEMDEEQLNQLCSSYGEVKFVSSASQGTAYIVTFNTSEEAQSAKEGLPSTDVHGQNLKVDFASRRPRFNNRQNLNRIKMSDCPLRLLVPHQCVGAVIGRGGESIRVITQKSNARVDVVRQDNPLHNEKVIIISGPEVNNCINACKEILTVIKTESEKPDAEAGDREATEELKLLAPVEFCGRLIGKQGVVVKSLMSETSTSITISHSDGVAPMCPERVVIIRGPTLDDVCAAAEKIYIKLKTCMEENLNNPRFMTPQSANVSMFFPGMMSYSQMNQMGTRTQGAGMPYGGMQQQAFQASHITVYFYIPRESVGAIIGSRGAYVNWIKQESQARIQIQEKTDEMDAPDRPVKIEGYQDAVWKACFLIYQKLKQEQYIQDDNEHVTSELMVHRQTVGKIIGKAGQNVRQIQDQTHCSIKLPEKDAQEEEEVAVLVKGAFFSVIFAQGLIRQLLVQGALPPQPPNAMVFRGGHQGQGRPMRDPNMYGGHGGMPPRGGYRPRLPHGRGDM